MPKRRTLELSTAQQAELIDHRDHDARPYLRERCAALLFIAVGFSPAQVAREKLFKPRDPDTLYSWLERYQQEGLDGLLIEKGRGRKPAFSPSGARVGRHGDAKRD